MLSLERLRTLTAVESYGSISAAAQVLHVTTSAASQQLAKLEREVGEKLLVPNGRGVRLTDAARLLVRHAQEILALVERTEADLEAHRDLVHGRLRLAAFATAARGFLPPVLRALRDRYPDLSIELAEFIDSYDALEPMRRGDFDLVVITDWPNAPYALPDGLEERHLLDDPLDVVLPAGHPLADRGELELAELAREDWIGWTNETTCHRWLRTTLRAAGIAPQILHTVEEHPTQMALVAAGLGTAIIPRIGRDPVPSSVRLIPTRPRLVRRFQLVWRADSARRPAVRAVIDALGTAAARHPGVAGSGVAGSDVAGSDVAGSGVAGSGVAGSGVAES